MHAFTIIELVMVLMIMGIFAAVTAPAFLDSLDFHRVQTAALRVKGDLSQARQQARLTSTAQTVTFSGGSYTLSNSKSLDNPTRIYTVNLCDSPYTLDSATANFGGSQTITFDGYGTPSSGGTIVLTAKSHQFTVNVAATTGVASVTSAETSGGVAAIDGN